MEEENYKAQIGFIQDNERNLSLEVRKAIYTLVNAHGSEGLLIENRAQNISWVRLDRLDAKTLSALVGLVQMERERLNRPAGVPARFCSSISEE